MTLLGPSDTLRQVQQAEQNVYRKWLASKGVPAAHLDAHVHAARVFDSQGGTTREAMSAFIRSEAASGSQPARIRNLQAAAKHLLAFHHARESLHSTTASRESAAPSVGQESALELGEASPWAPPGQDAAPLELAEIGLREPERNPLQSGAVVSKPVFPKPVLPKPAAPVAASPAAHNAPNEELLDLQLDLATPPPLDGALHERAGSAAVPSRRKSSTSLPPIAPVKPEPRVVSLDRDSCACGKRDVEAFSTSLVVGLILFISPFLYWGLPFLIDKYLARMLDAGLVAAACIGVAIFSTLRCGLCDETIEKESLTPAEAKSVLWDRVKLGALSLVMVLLAFHFKGKWDERRKWDDMTDADWAEYEERRHQELLDIGYEYDEATDEYYMLETDEDF